MKLRIAFIISITAVFIQSGFCGGVSAGAGKFVKERGPLYGVYAMSGGDWVVYEDCEKGRKARELSAAEKERLAALIDGMKGKDEAAYMGGKLSSALKEAGLFSKPGVKAACFDEGKKGALLLSPKCARILAEIYTSGGGKISAKLREKILGMAGGAKKTAKGEKMPSGFDWEAFGKSASAGDYAALSQYSVDRSSKTVRVMVTAKKKLKKSLLLSSDLTPESSSAAIKEAGLDQSVLSRAEAKLARAVDENLFFDVPLSKAAAFGGELAKAGFPAKPAGKWKLK